MQKEDSRVLQKEVEDKVKRGIEEILKIQCLKKFYSTLRELLQVQPFEIFKDQLEDEYKKFDLEDYKKLAMTAKNMLQNCCETKEGAERILTYHEGLLDILEKYIRKTLAIDIAIKESFSKML